MKKIMINPKLEATFPSEYEKYDYTIDERVEAIIYTCKDEFQVKELDSNTQQKVKSLLVTRISNSIQEDSGEATDMIKGLPYVADTKAREALVDGMRKFSKQMYGNKN